MRRPNGTTSQQFREDDSARRFVKLENGKYGGFRRGVANGPEPTRPARNRK